MNKDIYKKQVGLLLEVLPIVMRDERFALKGGTAINLFFRDFSRLSVDIDLCYLPIEDRETTFKNIHLLLSEIKKELEEKLEVNVTPNRALDGHKEAKLFVSRGDITIKIEPNFQIRGVMFDPVTLELSIKAQDEFEKYVEVKCVSFEDTYGGKICAALDRQHPRDLFDIKLLLENEGLTTAMMDSFIYYLLSSSRPFNEILDPNIKDIQNEYETQFKTMTEIDISLEELYEVLRNLINKIKTKLNEKHKQFILSFASREPKWELIADDQIKNYPSVLRKLHNQDKMSDKKVEEYIEAVKSILFEKNVK